MDDAHGVRFAESVGGLGQDLQPPRQRRLPCQEVAQGLAVDELHGDEVNLLGALPLVGAGDRLHDE